jgi:hypothetical protein
MDAARAAHISAAALQWWRKSRLGFGGRLFAADL